MVYYMSDDQKAARSIGVGTFYESNTGPCVVTAEHVIHDHIGSKYFVFRMLNPQENSISRTIESIKLSGSAFQKQGEFPDMTILQSGAAKLIATDQSKSHRSAPGAQLHKFAAIADGAVEVTSLITGERHKTVGVAMLSHAGFITNYLIIDLLAHKGESGTGFVDDAGRLYVHAKGFKNKQPVTLGDTVINHMAAIYGPLELD